MNTKTIFLSSLKESLSITLIIFILMIIVEIIVLKYKHEMIKFVKKNKFWLL